MIRSLSVLLVAGALLVACSPVSGIPGDPSGPAASVSVVSPGQRVPAAVVSGVRSLAVDYQQGTLGALSQEISDHHLVTEIRSRFQRWRRERVSPLRVTIVYDKPVAGNRQVVTVQYASDPRTPPWYDIYLFQLGGRQARIVGTTTGITGDTLTTASWSVTRTAHFIIYHSPYQLTGSDRHFISDLEFQRTQFARKFGVSLPQMAAFYLFPDQATMARLTDGACGAQPGEVGCTNPYTYPPRIEATMAALYHEPIHVYQLALEPPVQATSSTVYLAPLFIAEGTAVALEDRSVDPNLSDYCSELRYLPLDACARVAITHVQPLNILPDKGFKRVEPSYGYALGGSFVKYLILHYGYPSFGKFYYKIAAQPTDHPSDYDVASRSVYHQPIRVLLKRWTDDLCREGC